MSYANPAHKAAWHQRNKASLNDLRNDRRRRLREVSAEFREMERGYNRTRRHRRRGWSVFDVRPLYTQPCFYCGAEPVEPTVDHLVPLSDGGSNEASNLVPACLPCNRHKGSRSLDVFYAAS